MKTHDPHDSSSQNLGVASTSKPVQDWRLWRNVVPCLAVKFNSFNFLLSSVHTILVDILRYVRLYIKNENVTIYYNKAR